MVCVPRETKVPVLRESELDDLCTTCSVDRR